MLPVGELLEVRQVHLHPRQQLVPLALVANLQQLLHHVIRELILHHRLERLVLVGGAQHLGDHDLPLLGAAVGEALLDDVARKLVLRQDDDLARERRQDLPPLVLAAVLEHVLHDVVPVLILRELHSLAKNLVHDPLRLLLRRAVLQHALDHPASVRVRGQRQHVTVEGRHDELYPRGGHPLDALLNHVVAVLIANASEHVPVELVHHRRLLSLVEHLQRLLNHPAAVHLQRQRQHVVLELAREEPSLLVRAVFQKLLNDVVSKDVGDELVRAGQHLGEHRRRHLGLRRLQLLLDEPAAVLVARKLHDVIREVG